MKKRFRGFEAKMLILTVAVIIILGGIAGSTVAWMLVKSDPVKNTFTYGNIGIKLTETNTGLDDDKDDSTNEYSLMPETAINKDPQVTVLADSVDCWLFIKVEEAGSFDEYMEYEMADGWKALDGNNHSGIYYRNVKQSDINQTFQVLEGNMIKVKTSVTQQLLDDMNDSYPTLSFTAYAIQHTEINNPEEAWENVTK